MARRYHELKAESFVQATEDETLVIEAIRNLIGTGGELERTEIEGVHSNPLVLLTIRIQKEREIREVLDKLSGTELWNNALSRVEERLDEDQVFHIRIDKTSAFLGNPVLWGGGEAIELKLKIATYPSSRDAAIDILKEL